MEIASFSTQTGPLSSEAFPSCLNLFTVSYRTYYIADYITCQLEVLTFASQWAACTTTGLSCPVHMLGVRLRASDSEGSSSCTNVNKDWQTYSHCALYHSAMAPIIVDVNDICCTDRHFRFADKLARRRRGFQHFLSIDGAEIAAATTCGTDNCPSCQCPKTELANTE